MEDQSIMEAIHKNYIKTREINRTKQVKKEELTKFDKLILSMSTLGFFTGVVTLIAVIENMKF